MNLRLTYLRKFLGVSLALGACVRNVAPVVVSPPIQAENTPPAPSPAAGRLVVTLEPAERYNEPPSEGCARSPFLDRVFALVVRQAQQASLPTPAVDGRLCLVAQALMGLVRDGMAPPQNAVDFALSQVGIVEPAPNFWILSVERGGEEAILAGVASRIAQSQWRSPLARMGAARLDAASGEIFLGLFIQDSYVRIEPLRRKLSPGMRSTLAGEVLPPYQNPVVYLTSPRGVVSQWPRAGVSGSKSQFSVNFSCDAEVGMSRLEVMASSSAGPTVLANFPTWCGVEPPVSLSVEPSVSVAVSAKDAERQLFDLLNTDRKAAGLGPLAWVEPVARVARLHSQDMRDHKFFAHVSPRTGDVADRMKKAGLPSSLILENLARAFSVRDLHEGLMNSPGHRANILNSQARFGAVGVVAEGGQGQMQALYATQIFVRDLPVGDLGAERAQLLARMAALRAQNQLAMPVEDAGLARVAQRLAEAMARSQGRLSDARRDKILHSVPQAFRSVDAVVAIVAVNTEGVSEGMLAPAKALGLGLAQGRHPTFGPKALYLVMLLGSG